MSDGATKVPWLDRALNSLRVAVKNFPARFKSEAYNEQTGADTVGVNNWPNAVEINRSLDDADGDIIAVYIGNLERVHFRALPIGDPTGTYTINTVMLSDSPIDGSVGTPVVDGINSKIVAGTAGSSYTSGVEMIVYDESAAWLIFDFTNVTGAATFTVEGRGMKRYH